MDASCLDVLEGATGRRDWPDDVKGRIVAETAKPGRGKTKTGYLWALARDDRSWGTEDPPGVVYFYADGRAGKHPEEFLKGFKGVLLGACKTQAEGGPSITAARRRASATRRGKPAPSRCWMTFTSG